LNLPYLYRKLEEWNIKEVIIFTSFNKIGFTMSPNIDSYLYTANNNPEVGHLQKIILKKL
jgi:hypothetical protein